MCCACVCFYISVLLSPMSNISTLLSPMSSTLLSAFACLLLAYFFFFFFDSGHFAFAGLSPGDSIWIGLSAGFGESCLPPGFGRRRGVLSNAWHNQVEPTRYVGLQKVRLDGKHRRSFWIPCAWHSKSEVFRSEKHIVKQMRTWCGGFVFGFRDLLWVSAGTIFHFWCPVPV